MEIVFAYLAQVGVGLMMMMLTRLTSQVLSGTTHLKKLTSLLAHSCGIFSSLYQQSTLPYATPQVNTYVLCFNLSIIDLTTCSLSPGPPDGWYTRPAHPDWFLLGAAQVLYWSELPGTLLISTAEYFSDQNCQVLRWSVQGGTLLNSVLPGTLLISTARYSTDQYYQVLY